MSDIESKSTMGVGRMSWWGGYVNNCAANSIWFSAPYAFAQAGWLYGPVFLLCIALASWLTGLMYADIVNNDTTTTVTAKEFAKETSEKFPTSVLPIETLRNTTIQAEAHQKSAELDKRQRADDLPSEEANKHISDKVASRNLNEETTSGATYVEEVEVTLASLCQKAFGDQAGAYLVHFMLIFNFVPGGVTNIITCGHLLEILFPNTLALGYFLLIVGLITFFIYMIPNFEILGRISGVLLLIVILSGMLMIAGTVESKAIDSAQVSSDYGSLASRDPLEVLNGMGVFLFLFGGHATFPAQMWEMKNPARFGSMFSAAWFTIAVFQALTGSIGFWGYGVTTDAVIYRSMTPGTVTTISTIMALVYAIYSITLWMNIFFQIYERSLGIPTHKHFTKCVVMFDGNGRLGWKVSPVVARALFRTSVLLIQMLIALALPYDLGYIQAFVGSLTIGLDTFLVPPLLYLILRKKDLTKVTMAGALLLTGFGAFLCFTGTVVSIINIGKSISTFSVFNGF